MIFVHLNNSYTGSVKVLSNLIDEYSETDEVTLITSFDSEGFLKRNARVRCINVNYFSSTNRVVKVFSFFKFQLIAFYFIIKDKKGGIVYINTIEPFLLGVMCKIFGYKVICHLHENFRSNNFRTRLMFYAMYFYASRIICVSKFLYNNLPLQLRNRSTVIYNSIRDEKLTFRKKKLLRKVLMISSLKEYKGVYHFCELAKLMPDFKFLLVVSSDQKAINNFFREYMALSNLSIFPVCNRVEKYYESSDLILNLSDPLLIAETFGLTILEAKYFGLPAIVPEIGGITELITDGVDGFKVSVHQKLQLVSSIKYILNDQNIYSDFSNNALASITNFNFSKEYIKWKQVVKLEK